MNRNHPWTRTARVGALLAVAAMLAAGCASRTQPSSPQQTQKVVPLDLSDAGHVVSIHVGDEIIVTLGEQVRDSAWSVASYPKSLLAVTSSDPRHGTFTFRATALGQGLVGFTKSGRCGPPLLAAMPDGTLCPDSGKTVASGVPAKVALVTYTIRVN
jgi:hypothetical protein